MRVTMRIVGGRGVDLPCYYDRPPTNVKSDRQGLETLVEPDLSSEQLNLSVKTGSSPVAYTGVKCDANASLFNKRRRAASLRV